MCSQLCCSEQSCIKHHSGNRKNTAPIRSYRCIVLEIVFSVLKTHWKHHKRKDHNFLHRSYAQKEFSTPKKYFLIVQIFLGKCQFWKFWKSGFSNFWGRNFLGQHFWRVLMDFRGRFFLGWKIFRKWKSKKLFFWVRQKHIFFGVEKKQLGIASTWKNLISRLVMFLSRFRDVLSI